MSPFPPLLASESDETSVGAGEIPLVPSVSSGGDRGVPVVAQSGKDGEEIRRVMAGVAEHVWRTIQGR